MPMPGPSPIHWKVNAIAPRISFGAPLGEKELARVPCLRRRCCWLLLPLSLVGCGSEDERFAAFPPPMQQVPGDDSTPPVPLPNLAEKPEPASTCDGAEYDVTLYSSVRINVDSGVRLQVWPQGVPTPLSD